jgi:hypothetical protein
VLILRGPVASGYRLRRCYPRGCRPHPSAAWVRGQCRPTRSCGSAAIEAKYFITTLPGPWKGHGPWFSDEKRLFDFRGSAAIERLLTRGGRSRLYARKGSARGPSHSAGPVQIRSKAAESATFRRDIRRKRAGGPRQSPLTSSGWSWAIGHRRSRPRRGRHVRRICSSSAEPCRPDSRPHRRSAPSKTLLGPARPIKAGAALFTKGPFVRRKPDASLMKVRRSAAIA